MMMSSFGQNRDKLRVVNYKNAVENSQAKFGLNLEQSEGKGWRFGVGESGEYGCWVGVSGFSREELLVWCRDCSSFLITALLKDKARHALSVLLSVCVQQWKTRTHSHMYMLWAQLQAWAKDLCPFWGNPVIKACKCVWRSAVQLSAQTVDLTSVSFVCSAFSTWRKAFGSSSNFNFKSKLLHVVRFLTSWSISVC